MLRDDEDGIDLPLSSSRQALEGKQLYAKERQQRRSAKQRRERLKLRMSVQARKPPDTFGTKTIEQIVEKQMKPTSQKTTNPDEMIQKEEERQQVRDQTAYEEQKQVG